MEGNMPWYAVIAVSRETQAWMYAYTFDPSEENRLIYARIASPNPAASP